MIGLLKCAARSTPQERARMRAYRRQNREKLRRKRKQRERRPRVKQKRHGTPEGGGYTTTPEIYNPSSGGGGGGGQSASPANSMGNLEFDPHDKPTLTQRLQRMTAQL